MLGYFHPISSNSRHTPTPTATSDRFSLLLVDSSTDGAEIIQRLVDMPSLFGGQFKYSPSLKEGLELLRNYSYDIILIGTDISDGPEPRELISAVKTIAPELPIVAMCGPADQEITTVQTIAGVDAIVTRTHLDPLALQSIIHAMIRSKRLQKRLQQHDYELRRIMESIEMALGVIDTQGTILFTNRAAEQLLAFPLSLIGARLEIPLTPGVHRRIEWPRTGNERTLVDAKLMPIEWEKGPCFLVELRTASEDEKTSPMHSDLERTQRDHQKLESLGLLAGGVAHDFNNLLAGIMGHAEVLSLEISEHSPGAPSVNMIKQASRRAASLCGQLQAYASSSESLPESIALDVLIHDNEQLFNAALSGNIQLDLQPTKTVPPVPLNPNQIIQALITLVINARESIGSNQGCITLSTTQSCLKEINFEHAVIQAEEKGSSYICLEVSDNGAGIPNETLSRLHASLNSSEDVYTDVVGFAALKDIVLNHNGILSVESIPGTGSTFSIYFPEANSIPADPVPSAASFDTSWNYHGHIMVVDDEPQVRDIAIRMLKHLGCRVIAAASGTEALAHLGNPRQNIDLILLDLSMPVQSGPSTLRAIREIYPSIKVILMSGFEETHSIEEIGDTKFDGFLMKPFGVEALGSKLREVVESSNEASDEKL